MSANGRSERPDAHADLAKDPERRATLRPTCCPVHVHPRLPTGLSCALSCRARWRSPMRVGRRIITPRRRGDGRRLRLWWTLTQRLPTMRRPVPASVPSMYRHDVADRRPRGRYGVGTAGTLRTIRSTRKRRGTAANRDRPLRRSTSVGHAAFSVGRPSGRHPREPLLMAVQPGPVNRTRPVRSPAPMRRRRSMTLRVPTADRDSSTATTPPDEKRRPRCDA